MAQSRFSHRLTVLMRKRKISGQKIGDMIGKSQKTISRYANGEVEPSNEIKNQIYAAIAELSGIEEDGIPEEELELRELLWKDWGYENIDCEWVAYEYGVNDLDMENAERVESLTEDFDGLSTQEKKYYLENFFLFHCTNERDFELVERFHSLTDKKQKELLLFLEHFDFNYKSLNCEEEMAAFLQLVRKSTERPIDIKEVTLDSKNDAILKNRFEENLHEILRGAVLGSIPYHPVFLKYTPLDWYFLLRVMIFDLYESECKCDSDGFRISNENKIFSIMELYRERNK